MPEAESLPFDRAYGKLADNNALAPGIQRGMKRFHHLDLCGSLAIIGRL